MDFKFLHAADIHLDSPLRGLSKYEGVPADLVRTATRGALDNLIDLAIDEAVAFLIIAGDLYDGTWEAFATGLYFCKAMGRLEREGIDVFIVYGNHDAESHLTRDLPLPPNVKVFSAKAPESVVHSQTGTVLHGQSYRTRDPGGDLAAGYPGAQAGKLNIGLLHTALTGDRGHDPYAPCTPEQLAAKGYDYWALGHVHGFEIVLSNPYIVFPGNLQGRHIRETGAKGAVLATVTDGHIQTVEHVGLDVVRWALAEVDLADADTETEFRERTRAALKAVQDDANGKPLMVRIRLSGRTSLHPGFLDKTRDLREKVRAIAGSLSDEIWVEKLVLATSDQSDAQGVGDDFDQLLASLATDPEIGAALAQELTDFLSRLPADLEAHAPLLIQSKAGDLNDVLADAAAAVKARLQTGAAQ